MFSNEIKNKIKPMYTSNMVEEFYRPLLSVSKLYRRVSCYFSTEGIDLYADGLEELAINGGKVNFIISKEISKSDYHKIKEGYNLLEEIKGLRISQRNDILNSNKQKQLGNLAFMIAMGHARVKIAMTVKGLFHDKFGILTSGEEHVFFNGSANETLSGINKNYESISVDVSWDSSDNVRQRIKANIERFDRLWNNNEPGVEVIEASDLVYEEIAQFQDKSSLKENEIENDSMFNYEDISDTIIFKYLDNKVIRVDNTSINITKSHRLLKQGSDISKYFEEDYCTIIASTGYKDIEEIINKTRKIAEQNNLSVIVSEAVEEYLSRKKYSIKKYQLLGDVCKKSVELFPEDMKKSFNVFCDIVQAEVSRPLYDIHLHAAFYEYEMMRAANFSVPGSGKTSMILGVFAYLNRNTVSDYDKLERILVISPLSAFDSWKEEFRNVFGNKKKLVVIDSQSSKDFKYELNSKWGICNLILINYESLDSVLKVINGYIDTHTMLVFDEVHRIKNVESIRAKDCLELSRIPRYKYVLTGTPIPNSYCDIYNFLNLLHGEEYKSFFEWKAIDLKSPGSKKIREINTRLYPFFWRTNKKDLKVPPAESDVLVVVKPSREQLKLVEAIYKNEKSRLAIIIRLIQASTNPALVKQVLNFQDYEDTEFNEIREEEREIFNKEKGESIDNKENYNEFNLDKIESPKFLKGIELVSSLIDSGKKVLVWGIYVDTINRISNTLIEKGYSVNLVYGTTEVQLRTDLINEFKEGSVQVLVTNPQTLGESISLHHFVHDAVYFEYDYNLTHMLQSKDRIHRLGLKEEVKTRYYYLLTESESDFSDKFGFIDQKIYDRLKKKEEIMYNAIDNKVLSIEYSEDEIGDTLRIIDEERKRTRSNLR
ncbi:MAG: SNF2-related protein [Bacilli bacterium]